MSNWQNRIKEYKLVDPKEIRMNPNNFRVHPDHQRQVMKGILGDVGWVEAVLINSITGNMIDGHLRVEEAIKNKEETVPVLYVELSEEEENTVLATLNPVGQLATENAKKLERVLGMVKTRDENVAALVKLVAERNKLKYDSDVLRKQEDDDDDEESDEEEKDKKPSIANELDMLVEKWGVKTGQVWQLGDHRIACGDCRDKSLTKKLLSGKKIDWVITDPPYGIDAVGSDGRIGLAADFGRIVGDMEPFDPGHVLKMAPKVVMWGANHFADKIPASSHWLIWDKRDGDRHNDFADGEMAWVSTKGVVRILSHLWMGFSRASERGVKRYHPTQKPLAVMEWVINEVTESGDLVYDPYIGSGTTLFACNNIGRVCYGFDIDQRYIAVCLERWGESNSEPELIHG